MVDENVPVDNLHIDGSEEEESEDIVNPWQVMSHSQTGVDYEKLISKCAILAST